MLVCKCSYVIFEIKHSWLILANVRIYPQLWKSQLCFFFYWVWLLCRELQKSDRLGNCNPGWLVQGNHFIPPKYVSLMMQSGWLRLPMKQGIMSLLHHCHSSYTSKHTTCKAMVFFHSGYIETTTQTHWLPP